MSDVRIMDGMVPSPIATGCAAQSSDAITRNLASSSYASDHSVPTLRHHPEPAPGYQAGQTAEVPALRNPVCHYRIRCELGVDGTRYGRCSGDVARDAEADRRSG